MPDSRCLMKSWFGGCGWEDRKSTRLNSSHGYISYAVFCLKKKKKNHHQSSPTYTTCSNLHPSHSTSFQHPLLHSDSYASSRTAPSHLRVTQTRPSCSLEIQSRLSITYSIIACTYGHHCMSTETAMKRRYPYTKYVQTYFSTCVFFVFSGLNNSFIVFFFFFFNNPAPPEIYPFPLPDPLPI